MRPLLLQITVWEVKGALKGHEMGRPCTIRGLGTNWKSVFDGKPTRTTTPKILSISPLTVKEHPYKVNKKICKAVFS